MQTDLLILQDQNEVFSTGIKSEKGKGDNISKALESDDLSEGKDVDFLSTLIGITKSRGQGSGAGDQDSELGAESLEPGSESLEPGIQSSELKAQSLELKVEISELKAQGSELKAEGSELKAQSLELKVEISELKAEGSELKAQGPELKAEGSELKAQGSELKAQGSELKAQGSELKAEGSELKAQGSELKAEGSELKAQGPEVKAQGSELKGQGSELKGQGSELKAQGSELKAQGSELKAEGSELKAQGSELKAEGSELKGQGSELKGQGSELKAQGPELKAQNTDAGKAARISTIFKETESPRMSDREAKEAQSTDSKLKVESLQPEAQRSMLNAQSLNSNHQEAGEVVRNLIKNQASHEATPKIESNFQDIKTIAKNMENFDKNFSHKEPDNVLLFPESRSSDRVSDTGLHTKETQLIQKPLQTEVLTQIVKKAAFNLKNGQTEVKIDLKPEFLGRIQLKISTENQQVMVRMLTEIPLVKDIIENNINHLKADLQNHGLEIDKFNVFLTRDSDQHENGHENAEFLKKNGETGEGEADDILAEEMEEEDQFAHERTGANLIGVFA